MSEETPPKQAAPTPTRLATYALNVGTVQHIDAALTNIRAGGREDVAGALAALMQAVLDSKDLPREAKGAALEQVDYLAAQAATRAPMRQAAVGRVDLGDD